MPTSTTARVRHEPAEIRKFVSISDLFRDFASDYKDDPRETPVVAGANMAARKSDDSTFVNLCTAFVAWWRAKRRVIWRVKPDTAAYLRTVGLHFVPEKPPESWSGDAIVIESTDKRIPLFDDVFSVAAYRTEAVTTGKDRYFFVTLTTTGGAFVSSVKADVGRIDGDRDLAEIPFVQLGEPGATEDLQKRTISCTRFVFAFSFYALSPERVEIRDLGGPILRDAKRKPVKRQGKSVYLWQYKDMSIIYRRDVGADPRGPLDKTGLELSPVIVSPYIRWHRDKAVIVDQHESHRWKRFGAGEMRKL
ncbi:MAG: hypothetical protein CVU57_06270 [Deltaproteobacteria bacterium HGW-Deltaproteobacteria-15]|nr:MAG: hypothetical protein CVU57_06270 [Deltaproteobacteria bacterium HGW-Deltaproteobacteria-15]